MAIATATLLWAVDEGNHSNNFQISGMIVKSNIGGIFFKSASLLRASTEMMNLRGKNVEA